MIIITGGAGFIGSALVWALNERGRTDILIVDHLGTSEKWRNLVPLRYLDYIDKTEFPGILESGRFGSSVDAVVHLGACSSTTEVDADYLMENNYHYTLRLARWWEQHQAVRFIYASSAATYGDGQKGYSDDESALETLRPLNMYGYSKHLFDLAARRHGWLKNIVGIKYFNVYGPNEYHKGDMRSVINKAYPRVRDEGVMALFKSYREGYDDGGQQRDFIYVKDAVAMTLFFLDAPGVGGLYNVGTGTAHSWNELAGAIFDAAGKETKIEYIPMPEHLQPKYQYFTQADLAKIRAAGCMHRCRDLHEAMREYVTQYLEPGRVLGE
jgi:ADP-L-glycero-D-manno-heptose 6-epimerase